MYYAPVASQINCDIKVLLAEDLKYHHSNLGEWLLVQLHWWVNVLLFCRAWSSKCCYSILRNGADLKILRELYRMDNKLIPSFGVLNLGVVQIQGQAIHYSVKVTFLHADHESLEFSLRLWSPSHYIILYYKCKLWLILDIDIGQWNWGTNRLARK